MPKNSERFAWTVLLIAFTAFCALVVGVPTAIGAYVSGAMEDRTASLEILNGTVLLAPAGAKLEVNAAGVAEPNNAITLAPGDAFRTVENSRAVVWLFDGSNLLLWPDTRIVLDSVRATKFNSNRATIWLSQQSGHIRFEVAPPTTIKTRVIEVRTPEAVLALREGSYSATRTPGKTELVTHRGWATVVTAQNAVDVLQKERTEILTGQPAREPVPSARDLIKNGNFASGLDGWTAANRGEEEPVLGSTQLVVQDGRDVVVFSRTGAVKHCETYLYQPLDVDITDFDSVKLRLDLKLINQSLSGGGVLGSEYPLLIRLNYRDVYNNENTFVKGFYYQNKDGNPTHNGEQVRQGEWQTFEIDLLDPTGNVQPKPAYLTWLEIAASGHNYESEVTNVRLIAE